MANHRGSEGVVHVGTTAIAELRSWELTHENEPIEDTVLADTNRSFVAGLNNWSGSAAAFWDESDTNGQEALDVGSSVTLKFYGEGTGTGATFYTGTGIVTGVTRRAAMQGMVEADFNFRGNGALTQTTA
jgi:hypothetical protein